MFLLVPCTLHLVNNEQTGRTPEDVGDLVRARRVDLQLDQAALAKAANVDVKTIRSLEKGERWPRDVNRSKIEVALGWAAGSLDSALEGGQTFVMPPPQSWIRGEEPYRNEPELDFIVTTMQAALGMLQKRELWIAIQLINQASSDLSDYLDEQNQTNEGDQNEDITQSRTGSPSAVDSSADGGPEGSKPSMNAATAATDKPQSLIGKDQGSRDDYDLARRTGVTEHEWRMANEPQPENENQDTGTNDPA